MTDIGKKGKKRQLNSADVELRYKIKPHLWMEVTSDNAYSSVKEGRIIGAGEICEVGLWYDMKHRRTKLIDTPLTAFDRGVRHTRCRRILPAYTYHTLVYSIHNAVRMLKYLPTFEENICNSQSLDTILNVHKLTYITIFIVNRYQIKLGMV